jgi:hypothetical protein
MSHLVSNEVQNEHTAKCYLGLQLPQPTGGIQAYDEDEHAWPN